MFSVIKRFVLLTKRERDYSSFFSQYWPKARKILPGIWTSPLTVRIIESNGSIKSICTSLEPGRNFFNAVYAVLEEEGCLHQKATDEQFKFLRVEERPYGDDYLIVRRKAEAA